MSLPNEGDSKQGILLFPLVMNGMGNEAAVIAVGGSLIDPGWKYTQLIGVVKISDGKYQVVVLQAWNQNEHMLLDKCELGDDTLTTIIQKSNLSDDFCGNYVHNKTIITTYNGNDKRKGKST